MASTAEFSELPRSKGSS
ncbi:hypothetical protein PDE_02333 [Penicillium oxalicum 114-2]|uniref:Uncharacterized protein n=1 Tax=Penicillium oxalicum (strain 114-2 / CGMCC 5302) TaxID=933388 RepID=S7Z9Z1_PENO1|nr:hypothetical protein PDE_02333 [Penicillium oxalicum 114-2]